MGCSDIKMKIKHLIIYKLVTYRKILMKYNAYSMFSLVKIYTVILTLYNIHYIQISNIQENIDEV